MLIIACALALSGLAAVETSAQLSLRAENRVGRLVSPSSGMLGAQADLQLTPAIAFSATTHTSDLELYYAPQILFSTEQSGSNPSFLHYGKGSWARGLKGGRELAVSAVAFTGELDYASAVRLLGAEGTLPAFPVGEVVPYANADLYAALMLHPSRRLALNVGVMGGYTGPGVGQSSTTQVLHQGRGTLFGQAQYRLSRRSTVGVEAQGLAVAFQGGPTYTGIVPALSYEYLLSRDSKLKAVGGAQLTYTSNAGATSASASSTSFQPVAGLTASTVVSRSRIYEWTGSAATNLEPFYDPFRAVLVPRLVFEVRSALATPHKLHGQLLAQWYEPLPGLGAGAGPTFDVREERLAVVALSLARPLFHFLRGEIGAVSMWRPHGASNALSFANTEALAYLALTAATGMSED